MEAPVLDLARPIEYPIVLADIEGWPERFRRTKVVVEPDRAGAKKALEAGETIDGVTLVASQTWQSR